MNVHEHQAKELLSSYGVPVPPGGVAYAPHQAAAAAAELGGERWVVKAQVHAGGRGKAGGVRLAGSVEEVAAIAANLLGSRLVTAQTGPDGALVGRVLVEPAVGIARELYLGLVVDRGPQRPVLLGSTSGGVDVEGAGGLVRETIDPALGLQDFQCRKVAAALGLSGPQLRPAVALMRALYRCFEETDALQIEVNPLAVTDDGALLALDAKVSFDDNALFRRAEVGGLRDLDEEDPKETDASQHGLNYIALDGDVGCIVNGAGLAMATMDAITLHGARPANFLDVGGGASPEKVANAFRIVLTDPNVKTILVNIFAGINRCDWIAEGIVEASRAQEIDVPVVARLAGTNVEEGRRILAESGLALTTADNLDDAAAAAVASLNGARA
ncbi:MAG TPA: ADP-forming succinate--CoA ligase subunit beta [Gaiellaceae bacterium]